MYHLKQHQIQPTGKASLLSLPKEIRDEIFEYCLLYDGEIIAYPTWYEHADGDVNKEQELPSVNLLEVNKQIREEAAKIVFGKNTWRTPVIFDSFVDPPAWRDHFHCLRKLTLPFDFRAIDQKLLLNEVRDRAAYFHVADWSRQSLDQRRINLHEGALNRLHNRFLQGIAMVCLCVNVKSLTLDFTYCFCPQVCCRMVNQALQLLDDPFLQEGDLHIPLITGIGLMMPEEKAAFHHNPFMHCENCFIGGEEHDTWYCKDHPAYEMKGWVYKGEPYWRTTWRDEDWGFKHILNIDKLDDTVEDSGRS